MFFLFFSAEINYFSTNPVKDMSAQHKICGKHTV